MGTSSSSVRLLTAAAQFLAAAAVCLLVPLVWPEPLLWALAAVFLLLSWSFVCQWVETTARASPARGLRFLEAIRSALAWEDPSYERSSGAHR